MALVNIARDLCTEVAALNFTGVAAYTYNPLEYAWEPHAAYLRRYSASPKEVLMVGMNPGPFGMAQTGVPFGDVVMVRDWLDISGHVSRPIIEHARRPVEGFATRRREVSGMRLWGWARQRFHRPDNFFQRFFVANYCPLLFLDASGKNVTPDKLALQERQLLVKTCDRAIRAVAETLRPRFAVGIGAFATERLRVALDGMPLTVAGILHPSPANPRANADWSAQAEASLSAMGISLP